MVAHRQDAMEATIGSINESLRNLAREMARQRAERDDWRALLDRKGYPRNPNVGGYGK
jgi:hypothetical protein